MMYDGIHNWVNNPYACRMKGCNNCFRLLLAMCTCTENETLCIVHLMDSSMVLNDHNTCHKIYQVHCGMQRRIGPSRRIVNNQTWWVVPLRSM